MEQKIIQVVLGILVALMAWNFKTVNTLQVEMGQIQVQNVDSSVIYELRRQVDRLEILLQAQASEK